MVRAIDVADAVRLADRIHASIGRLGYPPVRIGIDTGPAVPREGDWYGTTVNRAARVAEAARPGEMLLDRPRPRRPSAPCSSEVRDRLARRPAAERASPVAGSRGVRSRLRTGRGGPCSVVYGGDMTNDQAAPTADEPKLLAGLQMHPATTGSLGS